ncbi:MAG: WYL domain-containing protein [Desulfobacterota bacterium]|nr:WYL domain-containing protein [Thermodesulfobacteriota bacterium]
MGSAMGSKNVYERFIWFDHQVRSKKYPNASRLATQFEISQKTAQRDIDFMRDRLFCPFRYDKSRKGYFYTDETFSLPMIYLSTEELSSLLIARKILKDISGGTSGPEISSIVDKITNLLQRHSISPDAIEETFSFHFIEYSPTPEPVFKTVLEGCLKKKRLSITYYSPASEEKNERTVEPYHLLNYMGTWHLIGYCHLRGEVRDFALNRILNATVLPKSFKIPSNFNFRDYFLSTFGLYKGKAVQEVTLRFTPEKSKWIRSQIWHRDQKTTLHEDGSLEISFPVSDFSEVKREILKHGSDVEVLKPKMLRDWIKSESLKISELYR